MSFWGATVITNLLSTIPVFGHDLVELIWGGLNLYLLDLSLINEEPYGSDILVQILLVARKCPFNGVRYCKSIRITVKRLITGTKQAVIRNFSNFEVSQRLNAGDLTLAMFVGIIEGDGWFSISKKGDYVMYELGLELGIRDVQLIYKIKKLLGVGQIFFSAARRDTEGRSKTVMLRVRNKNHLKNIILPIFEKYPLISNKF